MYNVHDELQKLSVEEIQAVQRRESLPFSVAAYNVAGDLNLSNMVRSAVAFGASKFYIIGKRRFDRRGCVGAQNYIELVHIEDPFEALFYLNQNYDASFVEQGGLDITCADFYNKNPCLIFGSESAGFPEDFLQTGAFWGMPTYSIAQIGVIRSLNVATAAGIAMFKVAMDLRTCPRSTL